MTNRTLFEFIKSRDKSVLEYQSGLYKLKIMEHIASAMTFIHKQGYIHGDLTSKGVFVNYKKVAQQDPTKLEAKVAGNLSCI